MTAEMTAFDFKGRRWLISANACLTTPPRLLATLLDQFTAAMNDQKRPQFPLTFWSCRYQLPGFISVMTFRVIDLVNAEPMLCLEDWWEPNDELAALIVRYKLDCYLGNAKISV